MLSWFNFWWDPALDMANPTQSNWTDPAVHYQLPKLFHELIVSEGKLKVANILLLFCQQEMVELS